MHIVFLELIIDPACSVVFEAEAEEADVMRRSPRNPKSPFFGRRSVLLSLMQGVMVLAIVLAVFAVALHLYRAEGVTGVENARTLTFTTLIVANLALILTNRSWSRSALEMLRTRNKALWWVLGGTALFLGLVLYVPLIRDRFHLIALHPIDLAICLVAGLASILWFEGLKYIRVRSAKKG
jgi:Ca2+-transporting ATPase